MDWYKRWIGDYARDTSRLSIAEHGAYCLMLDEFYSSEEPLPKDRDELYIIMRAIKPQDRAAVDKVLDKYWVLEDDGYINNKALKVMRNAQEYSTAQAAKAKIKWDKYYANAENKDIDESTNASADASKNTSPAHAENMPTRKPLPESQKANTIAKAMAKLNGTGQPLLDFLVTQDVTFRIFDHWRILHEHPQAKLSDKRKHIIAKALNMGYSEDDLIKSITGCKVTPFNMGDNEQGRKYDSIELILRDAEHIETFMEHAENPPKGGKSQALETTVQNMRNLVAKGEIE